jgi:TetR/AcrR family transcriptional repressor of nem operon
MRYPEGHKEEVRKRLVQAASSALRRDGIDGVSIPALMKKVGLTHGGFYAHFKNRDALVAAAVDAAADETAAKVLDAPVSAVLQAYLSAAHVARPGEGCVVAALGTEGRRAKGPVKRSFARAARGLVRAIDRSLRPTVPRVSLDETTTDELSDAALEHTARMVGAVVLARLVDDDGLRDRLLRVASAPAGADTPNAQAH